VDTLRQDLRHAIRGLRRSPGFAAVAILTLALGIGANTAIFSVVQCVLLNQLPYRSADRLVSIEQSDPITARRDGIGAWALQELARRSKSFDALALYTDAQQTLVDNGQAEVLRGMRVTSDFFEALGVRMLLGRGFLPEEEGVRRANVIVLSYEIWTSRFGSDRTIVGRTLDMVGDVYRVVGVLPADFRPLRMTNAAERPRVFMPFGSIPDDGSLCRSCVSGRAIGKLKPGVTVMQARADVDAVMRGLVREHPGDYARETTVTVVPLRDRLIGPVRDVVWTLFGAVALVLIIACGNVASLQLARSSSRKKEFAIRAALGGGSRRIVRQLLTENLLLGLCGAAAGLALGWAAIAAIVSLAPKELPRLEEIRLSGSVLLVTFIVSVATSLVFGIGPAWVAGRSDVNETLKCAKDRGSAPGNRGRRAVVVAEISAAFVLVGATGLLVRSFTQLVAVNAGFNPRHVLTMTPVVNGGDHPLQRYRQTVETVRSVPGVLEAGMVSNVPLSHSEPFKFLIEERATPADADLPNADVFWVSPGYFRVLEIPLMRGRLLNEHDGADAPPAALVSASFASSQFANEDPIGRRFRLGTGDRAPWVTIVGIVGDVRHEGLDREADQAIYEPQAMNPFHYTRLVVRTAGNPLDLERPIRAALHRLDPNIAIFHVQPMEDYVASSLAARSFALALVGLFGALALILAAVGVYGVLAHSVAERTVEIGIRAALGATPATLIGSELAGAAATMGAGIVIGIIVSLWAGRLIAAQLYGVNAHDALTLIIAATLLSLVGLAAGWLPAVRASRVDPMIALRSE
jgi:putative ABC transport system permease protein